MGIVITWWLSWPKTLHYHSSNPPFFKGGGIRILKILQNTGGWKISYINRGDEIKGGGSFLKGGDELINGFHDRVFLVSNLISVKKNLWLSLTRKCCTYVKWIDNVLILVPFNSWFSALESLSSTVKKPQMMQDKNPTAGRFF